MDSPTKANRPSVTYQRNRAAPKSYAHSSATLKEILDPEQALREKIAQVFEKENSCKRPAIEDDFDSAYFESSENAKKVHDLVQVGETRRFTDEVEFLLEGLNRIKEAPQSCCVCENTALLTSLWNKHNVQSSLREILERTEEAGDSSFGLLLKSHGVLGRIVEALCVACPEHEDDAVWLFPDGQSQSLLVKLLYMLLMDVRRLDFFVHEAVAIQLGLDCIEREVAEEEVLIGFWLVNKSLNIGRSQRAKELFCSKLRPLLSKLAQWAASTDKLPALRFGEKAAAVLDQVFTKFPEESSLHRDLFGLNFFTSMIGLSGAVYWSCLVSVSGSPVGALLLADGRSWSVFEAAWTAHKTADASLLPLVLSFMINCVDRCEDSVVEQARFLKIDNIMLLPDIASAFEADGLDASVQTLLALLLTCLCRQDRTNMAVMEGAWKQASLAKLSDLVDSFVRGKQGRRGSPEETEVLALLAEASACYRRLRAN